MMDWVLPIVMDGRTVWPRSRSRRSTSGEKPPSSSSGLSPPPWFRRGRMAASAMFNWWSMTLEINWTMVAMM
ncbi:hypothetical protein D3C72_2516050 [compost metagenome]